MKRVNGLYEKIISMENLKLADEKARRGKRKSYGVRRHDKKREENIFKLHEMLKNGTFKTSTYHVYQIYTPKERTIYRLPYFPDRIVHHAIMNYLEDLWVSVFTADSYSCIKGRGIHKAAKDVKKALRNHPEETVYCLKLDIKKFYGSIDHDVLKQIIRRKIKDCKLLSLLDEIIDSAEGVPIGNYLSQYMANLYLTYFDHWMKEEKKVKFYYRYADDIVILHSSKEFLHTLFGNIKVYLENNLKLQIKGNWQVFPVRSRGIDFVGYVFYHTHTRLRKSIKKNFCRRVALLNKRKALKKVYEVQTAAWWGWAKHCNSINLINKINESILRSAA